MTSMPSLFISHGAPTLAIEVNAAVEYWRQLAASLPRPRAILVASAHWSAPSPAVSASARPETLHDFHGFPDALYRLGYAAPGAPELARAAARLLDAAAMGPTSALERGLDHGAWVPLRFMYPAADVPVVQIALLSRRGPRDHYRMGQALAPLAADGVLVLASGGASHNLREWVLADPDAGPPAWMTGFTNWLREALEAGDHDALLDYTRAPAAARNHPTDEHLLPLFVALGAAGPGARAVDGFHGAADRTIALDAYMLA